MHKEDEIRVQHMIDAADSVERFITDRKSEDLVQDEMLRMALTRAIEIIGEAANKVSAEGREDHPDIPWRAIVGMRNRLVHAYFDVDVDVLWKTAVDAVPELRVKLVKSIDG